jgi:hypothetical protein
VCTYTTVRAAISCSAKGPGSDWARMPDLTVYYDHPVHAPEDHTVNIDVTDAGRGPGARMALELSPASARRLAEAIMEALRSAPAELDVAQGI